MVKNIIRTISKEAVKLENGTNTTVESRTEGASTIYKVKCIQYLNNGC